MEHQGVTSYGVGDGRYTFIDCVTYRRALARVRALERLVHDQLHRNVPMSECKLCRELRADLPSLDE